MFGTPKAGSLLGRTPLISASATRRSLHTTPRTAPTAPSRSEQVLEETSGYVVKALNSPVPVQVQEALRGDIRGATVKLHDSGWAWLVAGNRLLLWKFSTTHFTVHCKQVSLPVSSAVVSTWTADLVTVCVLPGSTDSSISLMAASPEGKLYYWSNVLRDTPTVTEATADVGGGYSFTLTSLAGCSGCLLATTQGGLFLVSLPLITQAGLVVRQLQIPRGMLSGFGRRVSSLFFGSQPEREAQEVRRVLTTFSGTSQKDVVFVLTSAGLQKWFIGDTHEQLVYDAALEEMIKDAVGQNNWFSQPRAGESSVSSPQLSLWIVDMQLARYSGLQ